MNQQSTKVLAGFWSRATAGLIDAILVAVLVCLVASGVSRLGQYMPVEATMIACYAVYTMIAIAWKGRTLGCWVCSHVVVNRGGSRLSIWRAASRSILVAVFQLLLGLPFLIVAAKPTKRGWHDVLTGSSLHRLPGWQTRNAWAGLLLWLGVIIWIGIDVTSGWKYYQIHRAWCVDADISAESRVTNESAPIEVFSLTQEQKGEMAAWLVAHAQDPTEYIINYATRHQVTLLGEIHGKKQYLALFNRLIPELYHRAKVRTIALECCLSEQNDDLARLITGETFDRKLARKIAREAVWNSWAWQGYWDVLEIAWQINQSVPAVNARLQVVGIAPSIDLPSLALVKYGPWIEKLRVLRLSGRIDAFSQLVFHDAFYASCVEQAAFDEGKRTVVWVGAAHVYPSYPAQRTKNGHMAANIHRMGAMLIGRYGNQIGQVVLHQKFSFGGVAQLFEELVPDELQTGFAIQTTNSPFARLRDGDSTSYFTRAANMQFSDLVSSYLFLVPESELETCDWMEGFVSRRMFGRNKPFYEMLFGHKLKNHRDASQNLSAGLMRM